LPADSPTDLELLTRAREGDEPALVVLYDRHVDGLWAFVHFRVGRDPMLCEDVVQATLLAALEPGSPAFDPQRGSLRSWLCSLSRNVIRKHLRDHQRAHALTQTWERIDATLVQIFQNLDSQPLGDEVLARAETRDLVNMTIANLPDSYRDALERKYVHGHSLRELAERFELSEAATKSLLARARRAFRDSFAALASAFGEELSDVRA
jgi:RNA polymerase sigma-70 factor (ECF subfamily)